MRTAGPIIASSIALEPRSAVPARTSQARSALGGRVVEAQGQVDGAARDAARAASVQTDGAQVGAAALAAAQSDLTQSGRNSCPGGVSVIPGAGGSAAGHVAVTVRCTINLAFFPGLGARTIHGSSVAPLDPYSYRNW